MSVPDDWSGGLAAADNLCWWPRPNGITSYGETRGFNSEALAEQWLSL